MGDISDVECRGDCKSNCHTCHPNVKLTREQWLKRITDLLRSFGTEDAEMLIRRAEELTVMNSEEAKRVTPPPAQPTQSPPAADWTYIPTQIYIPTQTIHPVQGPPLTCPNCGEPRYGGTSCYNVPG